jgi:hypothetical protein
MVDISSRYQYNIRASYTISTRTMYDDYDLDYTYSNEFYTYDLDEVVEHHMQSRDIQQDAYEMDDDYARDSCDYNDLAYRHYA